MCTTTPSAYAPQKTLSIYEHLPPERTLNITGTKTRRESRGCAPERGGAHVVTYFPDGGTSLEYVAKIYDGVDGRTGMETWDCMAREDEDYAVDA